MGDKEDLSRRCIAVISHFRYATSDTATLPAGLKDLHVGTRASMLNPVMVSTAIPSPLDVNCPIHFSHVQYNKLLFPR